jgi:hypothetical protein
MDLHKIKFLFANANRFFITRNTLLKVVSNPHIYLPGALIPEENVRYWVSKIFSTPANKVAHDTLQTSFFTLYVPKLAFR